MTNKPLALGLVAAELLMMAGGRANVASADAIVYSNLGPGNTYLNTGLVVGHDFYDGGSGWFHFFRQLHAHAD